MRNFTFALFLLGIWASALGQDLYNLDSLRSIYIQFYNAAWEDSLVNNWYDQNDRRQLASLQMNGTTYDSVAIRYKGNATFYWAEQTDNPKRPLNIDMDDYIADQKLLGYHKVKLANAMFDPTVLRDVLGFKIYRQYMPAPEANWMKVYINGSYNGLFPNTESINRPFLTKHFDYKKGALFKCDPASQFGSGDPWESSDLQWYGPDSSLYYGRYELKTEHGWAELVQLIDILNNSPQDLETVLNIDRALWYLAVNTALCNYDSYNGFYMHNYYLYQHKNGLFQILPWDLSEVFLGVLFGNGVVTGDDMYEWDIFNANDPFGENRPLVDYVASHPLYRKQYIAHIRTIIDEVLNTGPLLAEMQGMQSLISNAHAQDGNAFFGLGSWYFSSNLTQDINSFGLNVAGIIPTTQKRKTYLNNHPEISLMAPNILQVEQDIAQPAGGETVTITATIQFGSQVDLMISTNEYASHFEAFPMYDDGMHGDAQAGDGIFGAAVPYNSPGDEIKYYIRAQNLDAMKLSPERAEYEFYSYTVGNNTNIESAELSHPHLWAYPTPLAETLYIQSAIGFNRPIQEIQVYDLLGKRQLIEEIHQGPNKIELSTSDWESGIYFIYVPGYQPIKVVK